MSWAAPASPSDPVAVLHLTPVTPGRPHYAEAVGKVQRALVGSPPMPHQEHFHRLSTEMLEDGSWAYQTILKFVPRQAGKTTGDFPLEVHRCIVRPLARCQFTAQTRQAARDTVVDEWGARFRRSPFGRLGKVRQSQGSEGIYFTGTTDASLRVFPPEEGGLDGKANERVTVDEPWKIDPITGAALDNSILPTFNTTGGQLTMISTAGTARSTWLRGYVEQGRAAVAAGLNTGTAILEYGLPEDLVDVVRELLSRGASGKDFDRAVQLLAEHNPAHGYTLRVDALANGIRAMLANPEEGGADGVLRAYGNVWTTTSVVLIPPSVMKAATLEGLADATLPDTAALGVGVGLDGADTAVVAAWRDHTGRPFWRVVEHVAGTLDGVELVRAYATSRQWHAIASAGAGPVLEVVDAAERAERRRGDDAQPFAVARLANTEYGTAAQQVLALLLAPDGPILRHDGHPALLASAEGVVKRLIGDGAWAWGRVGSEGSIATLEAATVALWAFDHVDELGVPAARTFARR